VHSAGEPLRDSTVAWFRAELPILALGTSLETVAATYARALVS
jgi:hypothetical protein